MWDNERELIQRSRAERAAERREAACNAGHPCCSADLVPEGRRERPGAVDSQLRLAPVALKNRERYTDARTHHAAASIVISARLREMFTQDLPRKLSRGGYRGALQADACAYGISAIDPGFNRGSILLKHKARVDVMDLLRGIVRVYSRIVVAEGGINSNNAP